MGRPSLRSPIARVARPFAHAGAGGVALPVRMPPLAGARRRLAARVRPPSSRRVRIVIVAMAVSGIVLGGGWMWLRGSSLVAVRRVRVNGLSGADARAIEGALSAAARRMTTLEVSPGALRAAVSQYPEVSSVTATASFPHELHIHVVEQPPVAALSAGGLRTAVAADGVVLGPALLSSSLPNVYSSTAPGPGHRVTGSSLLAALTVLAAAPAPLARLVSGVSSGNRGLTVTMKNGLLVYFGDPSRPHAKWLSLARVLADPSAAGASYVDVRLPSRPAAGFPGGVSPSAANAPPSDAAASPAGYGSPGSATSSSSGSSESTVASLATALAEGSGTNADAPATSPGASADGSQSSGASSAAGRETSSSGSGEAGGEASPTGG